MNCTKCGKAMAADARFCPSCGTPAGPATAPGGDNHPTEFHVVGDVMQAVVIPLQAGQEVQAEPGALLYMAGDVEMDSTMKGGLWGGLKRMVVGESLFITRFRSRVQGQVAFAAPHPGKIRQIQLGAGPDWLCQRDSFLCATSGVDVTLAFTKRFGAGLFGGEGFILQRLTGRGTCFIHGGGNFIEHDLLPGQTLRVDTGCIVTFEESVRYDIQFVGGFKNALFGGEGLFLATLTGPGKAILQTLPFSRLAGRILGLTKEGTGGVSGVGGTLRDIGNIFGGNE
jgi:uncharacterized protein (TIGR00266 family)